jgi:hypothetical protein
MRSAGTEPRSAPRHRRSPATRAAFHPLADRFASTIARRRPPTPARAPAISPDASLTMKSRPLTLHFHSTMITTLPLCARPPSLARQNRPTQDRFLSTGNRFASRADRFLTTAGRSHSATATDARANRRPSRLPSRPNTSGERHVPEPRSSSRTFRHSPRDSRKIPLAPSLCP